MSSAVEIPEKQQNDKVTSNEILLQVKALQDLKRSLRIKTVNMKKPPVTAEITNQSDTNLKKESQDLKIKKPTNRKGDSKKRYFTNFMSELIATALLMLIGCMGCAPQADNPPAVHHMSSLSFGFVVLTAIQMFGHISGAHLNPAVTLTTVIFGMISPAMGVVYIVAQFMGAVMGFALLKLLLPESWVVPGFCMTKPHAEITAFQCFVIETIITFILILVCCSVWDKRNETKQDSTPMRFAFIIAGISMCAGPLTGASMNTVRSFAPAFLEGDYTNQWIYWVAPTLGAVIACSVYHYFFGYDEEKKEQVIELEEVNEMITEKN